MRKLQSLIFDVDGTLADTERDAFIMAITENDVQGGNEKNYAIKRGG